jgi:hypothetical protein
MAARLVTLDRFAGHNQKLRAERRSTLRGLLANAISLLAFVIAMLFALSRYVSAQTLVWVVGLFSAAFGLGARPLVDDFLAGISFIFEDTFDVGEKVLPAMATEAMLALPNMLEPWQIISETGAVGESAELTLVTKAKFGHGAEMRPRLLAFVRECLTGAGISLLD